MNLINEPTAAIKLLSPGEQFTYKEVSKKNSCNLRILARRHLTEKNINQQRLTPQQEEELVTYIVGLIERRLPPTREMIANFVLGIGKIEVSETWITCFIHRHPDLLLSRWTAPMVADRHAANSYEKYSEYFGTITYLHANLTIRARFVISCEFGLSWPSLSALVGN
jgi:hypothetical protein